MNKLAILFALFIPLGLSAQTWTDEQKEVWNIMDDLYNSVKEKDHDNYKSFLHENYSMWYNEEVFPANRTSHILWDEQFLLNRDMKPYDIHPLKISLVNNTAVVHHLARTLNIKDGKYITRQNKWTEVLIKENDKWVLITSHGQLISEK